MAGTDPSDKQKLLLRSGSCSVCLIFDLRARPASIIFNWKFKTVCCHWYSSVLGYELQFQCGFVVHQILTR